MAAVAPEPTNWPSRAGAISACGQRKRGGLPGARSELDLDLMLARAEAVAATMRKPVLEFDDLQLVLDLRPTALRQLVATRGFPAAMRIGGRPLWRTPLVVAWLDQIAEEAAAARPD